MAKFKVLLLTDSIAFPRSEPERLTYEETYVALLKSEFPEYDFIHHGRGGATLVDLFKHSIYYHELLKPDLVFIQAGIVDCAPRALTIIEHQLISRVPVLNGPLISLVKKYSHRLRAVRNITYTTLAVFEEYVSRFEDVFGSVGWIDIVPASAAYEDKLQGIRLNTGRYRDVLRKRHFISLQYLLPSDIMSDFHHLTRSGHHKLFMTLCSEIRRTVEERKAASDVVGVPVAGDDILAPTSLQ